MRMKELAMAIADHFDERMPERIKKLRNIALNDLYYGPVYEDSEWPGYSSATNEIHEWCMENIHDVYVSLRSGTVEESPPEDDTEEYCHVSAANVKKVVFGDLVSSGGL